MKKRKSAWLKLAAALLCACFLCGCGGGYALEDLSAAVQGEILDAYCAQEEAQWSDPLEEYREDLVSLTGYCGTYGGHIVFTKRDDNYMYAQVNTKVTVGGVSICTNPDGEANPLVYLSAEADSEHRVLSLAVAYERGFFDKSDLRQIARCMRAWQDANAPGEKYSLTAGEGADFLLEPLPAAARAGERILFRTDILMDADIVAYLNGERLPAYTPVQEDGWFVAWEFAFTMPAEDAVIDLKVEGGLLPA